MEATELTTRDLRRRWKPTKEQLQAERPDHPTNIRIHRACSWLQQAEAADGDELDLPLICQWIAFNALYGQWNEQAREPAPDRECWRRFIDRILDLDADGHIEALLTEHKRLVMTLLEDEFLSRFYWEDPSDKRAGKSKKAKFDAQTWYLEKRWALILDRVLERVYLLRCQLMHGAATFRSGLNRTSLRRCSLFLGHLLPTVLLVMTDHGADEDWGVMCYPPMG